MSDLKPCPFCGGNARLTTWTPTAASISCIMCGAHFNTYTEAEAIAAWNARTERTCIVTHGFNCSNCGKQIGVVRNCEMYETCDGRQEWKSLDHEVCDVPNYCPNCGAKVLE